MNSQSLNFSALSIDGQTSVPNDIEKLLRERQMPLLPKLTGRLQANRIKLMEWVLMEGRSLLELKCKTIGLAMRMFDYYLLLIQAQKQKAKTSKGNKPKKTVHLLDDSDTCRLVMITLLFSCAKYNQIYPPCLNDFNYVCGDKYKTMDILLMEVDIIERTKCGFAMTTVQHWYGYLYHAKMPEWSYECYIRAYYKQPEKIARVIGEVELYSPQLDTSSKKLRKSEILLKISKETSIASDKLSKKA